MTIDQFKTHFHQSKFIHLNNSGQALIPDLNRDLAVHWIDRFYKEAAFCAIEGWNQTDVTRNRLADFIGAAADEVSFFQTTASALSQVALGLPLKAGDEILTWDQEYPSNYYPWRVAADRSGARLIEVASDNWETPVKKILSRVSEKTRAIAVSWVQYQTGAVTDLKELSSALKKENIWLVADVIQGVGVRPINFEDTGFDVLCGGSHKWLCSGYGAGYMALKKSRMQQLAPHEVGAMTYGNPDTEKKADNLPKNDSTRYEPGSKSIIEIIAMQGSLELFSQCGIQTIFTEASRLAGRLSAGLTQKYNVIQNGPIVNLAPKNMSQLNSIMQKLTEANVSFAKRGPGVRLSVHAYIRDSEIDYVLNLLN